MDDPLGEASNIGDEATNVRGTGWAQRGGAPRIHGTGNDKGELEDERSKPVILVDGSLGDKKTSLEGGNLLAEGCRGHAMIQDLGFQGDKLLDVGIRRVGTRRKAERARRKAGRMREGKGSRSRRRREVELVDSWEKCRGRGRRNYQDEEQTVSNCAETLGEGKGRQKTHQKRNASGS